MWCRLKLVCGPLNPFTLPCCGRVIIQRNIFRTYYIPLSISGTHSQCYLCAVDIFEFSNNDDDDAMVNGERGVEI